MDSELRFKEHISLTVKQSERDHVSDSTQFLIFECQLI